MEKCQEKPQRKFDIFSNNDNCRCSFLYYALFGKQDVIRFLAEIESDAVNRLLTTMMPAVYLCALLFVFFLVTFANKYQLECRSKELGLYLLFGMKRRRLFLQLLMEGLLSSLWRDCWRRISVRDHQPCDIQISRSGHYFSPVQLFRECCCLDSIGIYACSGNRPVYFGWPVMPSRNPPASLWRNSKKAESRKNRRQYRHSYSRHGTFAFCLLARIKPFHGRRRGHAVFGGSLRHYGDNTLYTRVGKIIEFVGRL